LAPHLNKQDQQSLKTGRIWFSEVSNYYNQGVHFLTNVTKHTEKLESSPQIQEKRNMMEIISRKPRYDNNESNMLSQLPWTCSRSQRTPWTKMKGN
jgi:hypothetical protein